MLYRRVRLQALADSPDAFVRTLAEEGARSDEEWAARLAFDPATDLPLVAEVNGEPAGLAWGKIGVTSPDTAHLFQMWVAPAHRGLGIGRMLVDTVVSWAARAGVRHIELGVTWGDTPAVRLYSRAGFEPIGEPAPLRPGSTLLAQTMRLVITRETSG